jgi:DNA-binding transcriptional LysR family regulator
MSGRTLDSRHLEYFLAVVDQGTVTRAAAALRIAQPSLSQAIRTLERDIGSDLFHRIGRTLVLSAAGEALIDPARQALRDLATARASVAAVQQLAGGRLDVATLPTLAVDPLATIAGSFRRHYPDITVHITEAETTNDVTNLVKTGGCELGLAHLPIHAPEVTTHHLATQRLQIVLPSRPAATTTDPIPIRKLRSLSFVAGPAGTSSRDLLDQALINTGARAQIAVETSSRDAIVPLVLAGAGAALLPAAQAAEAGRRGAAIFSTRPAITRNIGLIHRHGPLSPAARAFLTIAGPNGGA